MSSRPAASDLYLALRDQLFRFDLSTIAPTADVGGRGDEFEVLGVATEIGLDIGWCLVATLCDGTASVYYSSGGGCIGGAGRPHVRAAALRLVATARSIATGLPKVEEHPLPGPDRVRFSLFTRDCVRAAEIDGEALVAGGNDLLPLFVIAHEILADLGSHDPT